MEKLEANDKKLAGIFNEIFVNIIPNLGINTNHNFLINTDNENDPTEKTIAKYKNHPSIISIKTFMENSDSSFSFQQVPKDKITKTNEELDPKKVVQSNDIPTKLIKYFFSDYIYIYIKDGRKEKSNCRPVSILSNSNVSKVYERCLHDQMYDFFENKFSRY